MGGIFNTKKKSRARRRQSGSSMLLRMFFVSCLVHAAVIYLIPSIDIFVSAPQYIEVDTFLGVGEREIQSESKDEPAREYIPAMLNPIEPDIPKEWDASFEQNVLMPEKHDQLPQSLDIVQAAQPIRPVMVYPEPEMSGNVMFSDAGAI